MSQLEFRDYTILASSEWKGIEVYNSEGNVASLGNDTGDFRMTDVHYATADELEQIATKLRELNGEHNPRALDERVKELIAYTYEAARESEGHIGEPTYHDENCSEDAAYHKLMLIKITDLFPELLTDDMKRYLYSNQPDRTIGKEQP